MTAAAALAAELVPLLPGWRAVPAPADGGEDFADLVRDVDTARVRLRVGGWRREGRVTFLGCWPRFRDGSHYTGGEKVEITCSARRAPRTLAAEFLRRFLPLYEPALAEAVAFIRAHDANASEAGLVAQRIAAAIGGAVAENKGRNRDAVVIRNVPEGVSRLMVEPAYTSPTYAHPIRVNFEAHGLDPETAAAVLTLIRDAERTKPANVRVDARGNAAELVEDEYEAEAAIAPRRRVLP